MLRLLKEVIEDMKNAPVMLMWLQIQARGVDILLQEVQSYLAEGSREGPDEGLIEELGPHMERTLSEISVFVEGAQRKVAPKGIRIRKVRWLWNRITSDDATRLSTQLKLIQNVLLVIAASISMFVLRFLFAFAWIIQR